MLCGPTITFASLGGCELAVNVQAKSAFAPARPRLHPAPTEGRRVPFLANEQLSAVDRLERESTGG